MRLIRALALGAILTTVAGADEKTDEAAKKGALKEKSDPAVDRKHQEENVKRLQRNADEDRRQGNRIGAWAAERDKRHAEKLIKKDKDALKSDEH